MRVFVLCTGRCGSMTLSRAFRHVTNYTTAHESGRYLEWDYPDRHIEIDNRLAWFLGVLGERYGQPPDAAAFVHLHRDRQRVIDSFIRRSGSPIITAYQSGIVQRGFETRAEAVAHYVDSVLANIGQFLEFVGSRGVPVHSVNIHEPEGGLRSVWSGIEAEGDFDAAMSEFATLYNRGPESQEEGSSSA